MKRRILAALAALAVGATALFGTSSAALAVEPTGSPYVAIGDSEAAGTGNMPYLDAGCLRSKKAYPELLGAALGTPVVSAACAGDDTAEVTAQATTLAGMGSLGPATQLVTITAGVNNIDWQSVLIACSSTGTPAACEAAKLDAAEAAAGIPVAIAELIGLVRNLAPAAQIVVTGYPLLFGMVSGTCHVGSSGGAPVAFTAQQTAEINAGVAGVNTAVSGGVDLYQAVFTATFGMPDPLVDFVDVSPAFEGHRLCDTGDRWIIGLSSGKGTADRGFHPNTAGQQAYAWAIAGALAG